MTSRQRRPLSGERGLRLSALQTYKKNTAITICPASAALVATASSYVLVAKTSVRPHGPGGSSRCAVCPDYGGLVSVRCLPGLRGDAAAADSWPAAAVPAAGGVSIRPPRPRAAPPRCTPVSDASGTGEEAGERINESPCD